MTKSPTKSKKTKVPAEAKPPKAAKAPREKSPLVIGKLGMRKDPRVYATEVPRIASAHKRILGLDLGTNCGVAFCDIMPGHPVKAAKLVMGQWSLALGDYDSGPMRHIRFKQFLAVVQPDLVMFEDVKFVGQTPLPGTSPSAILARAVKPIEFIGGLKTTLTTWCEERNIPCEGVGIGEIKRYATGKGNTDKLGMIAAANVRFGIELDPVGYESSGVDNICDAAFVCSMAVELYSEGITGESAWPAAPPAPELPAVTDVCVTGGQGTEFMPALGSIPVESDLSEES